MFDQAPIFSTRLCYSKTAIRLCGNTSENCNVIKHEYIHMFMFTFGSYGHLDIGLI